DEIGLRHLVRRSEHATVDHGALLSVRALRELPALDHAPIPAYPLPPVRRVRPRRTPRPGLHAPCPASPCPALLCPALPYPASPCPALLCPALPYPAPPRSVSPTGTGVRARWLVSSSGLVSSGGDEHPGGHGG